MGDYNLCTLQRTGSAHRVCQDRLSVLREGDRLLLVAADGHGGRPYARSGLGARFACAAAMAVLRQTDENVLAAVKDRYDAMVAKHLAMRPPQPWEAERLGDLPPSALYGATLLAAVLTKEDTRVYQLGDGEIHALKQDGTFFPSLPEDEGCHGSMTTSLANGREVAVAHARQSRYPEPAAALMLFTDGCDGGMLQAAAGLAKPSSLQEQLEAMLRRTNRGDDQTFLLAYDPEAVEKASFRENLTHVLQTLQAESKRNKRECREREDYEQLHSYLQLAARKAARMSRRNSPELEAYLQTLKPGYERYEQLRARFAAEERNRPSAG